MAGSVWPTLAAGAKAKASEVESKFDWIELDIVPMSAGTKTDATYDLGESSFRWRDIIFSRQLLGGAGSVGSPTHSYLSDTNTGLINTAADQIGIVTGGGNRFNVTSTLITSTVPFRSADGSTASPTYSWTSATNSGMFWTGSLVTLVNAGSDILEITNTSIRPPTDNTIPLGQTARRFSEIHVPIIDSGGASLNLKTSATDALIADTAGIVTKPLQSSFLAYNSVTNSNVTGDGTSVTIEFDTEVYDQNADFNNTTDTYTCPVASRVLLIAVVEIEALTTSSHSDATLAIVTSNRSYQYTRTVTGYPFQNMTFILSVIADMDASDTASCNVTVNGASADVEIAGSASPHVTYFSGSIIN